MDEFLELLKLKLNYSGLDDIPPDELLVMEIESAIAEINYRRNFESTDEYLVEEAYEWIVVQLASASVLKTGAHGQTGHSENGISRSYGSDGPYPRDLLSRILWVVR